MKIALLVLAAFFGYVVGQGLVANEVAAIIAANPGISEASCTEKCDEMFDLLDPDDEAQNDRQCAHQCNCQIHHTCA